MGSTLLRLGSGAAALILAGCANVGQGIQQIGAAVANAGRSQATTAATTATQGAAQSATQAATSAATEQAQRVVTPAAPPKPKTPVEICADNAVVVNSTNPSVRTTGNYSSQITYDKNQRAALEYKTGRDEGGIMNIYNQVTKANITPKGLAACTAALTQKETPASCISAWALVIPNSVGPVQTAPQGYSRISVRDRDGTTTVAHIPQAGTGLRVGKAADIAACHADLGKGLPKVTAPAVAQ